MIVIAPVPAYEYLVEEGPVIDAAPASMPRDLNLDTCGIDKLAIQKTNV